MANRRGKSFVDSFIIGAALFSMFFGAGNMIFPPYLGLKAGTEWFSGFLGYYIADIGLALIAIFAQIKYKSSDALLKPVGTKMSNILMFAVVMCIGPIISIPRTAATTYELSIAGLMPDFNMTVFYLIFFAVVLLLCIKQSAVVDIIGKILTPVLFIGLLFLIVKGTVDPLGSITLPARTTSVIGDGIEAGYQSMDFLAAIIFGVLILNSAADKGHTTEKAQAKVAAGAGIVAGAGLLIIYLGLTYLGATVSSVYDMHIYRTELLIGLIQGLIPGQAGLIFFAIIAGLACMSTAIALTSSAAEYLSRITKNKVSYKIFVIAICVFGALISSLGVEQLITIASPILSIIYPPILVLVLLSFIGKYINVWCYRFAAMTAMLVGALETVATLGFNLDFLSYLPLSNLGLGWVVPAAVLGIIGQLTGLLLSKKGEMKKI